MIGILNMFRALYYRWLLKRILSNAKLNQRQRCLALINLLSGGYLQQQLPSQLNTRIFVLQKSISVYIRTLKEINLYISRNLPVSSNMVPQNVESINFGSFLTDEQNYYVDLNNSFGAFLKESTHLMESLSPSDTAEHGYFEHHARVLSNVLSNIESILTNIAIGATR